MTDPTPWSPQVIARLIGILIAISVVAGGFGEGYLPSVMIVAGDAAASAKNIAQHQSLFRFGFAAYVIEGLCDAGLTGLLYLLLRPAGRELALIALLLRIVSTAAFASSESFYFSALSILNAGHYLKAFSSDQMASLVYVSLKFYGIGGIVPTLFYGVAWIVLGYLIWVSHYLPRWLGALVALGGLGFVIGNFALILGPTYSSQFFLLPMVVAMLVLGGWMLVKGVDIAKWTERTAR